MKRRMRATIIGVLAMLPILRAPLTVARSGGVHSRSGTVSKADVGSLNGGAYTLVGGFWDGAGGTSDAVCLPLIER